MRINVSDIQLKNWPTYKTACAIASTTVNVACEILKSSTVLTLGLNAPIRIFSIVKHHEDPYKIGIELLAFAALFFPYGRPLAIAIDVASELIYFANSVSFVPPTPPPLHFPKPGEVWRFLDAQGRVIDTYKFDYEDMDPEDPGQARKILDLPEGCNDDPEIILQKYKDHIQFLKKKISRAPQGIGAVALSHSIERHKIAYQTLMHQPPPNLDGEGTST